MVFDHAARGVYALKIPPRSKALIAGHKEAYEDLSKVPQKTHPEKMMKHEEDTEHYVQVRSARCHARAWIQP